PVFLAVVCVTSSKEVSAQSDLWAVPEGFVVEAVVSDLFLPVNIAFVPNPQSAVDAPIYYITELYGQVKVVLRNGEVRLYADGLLNFTPTGDFPGSGEMGVTGIVVEPNTGDLFVTMVYENGGVKNKVVRMSSTDGGRSVATITTLLDEIPGPPQSHQIQAATIGLDGKLYVQIGDGFDADAAQRDGDLRGKVLRMNLDGSVPDDNPSANSYVYAKGFRNPFGGAWRAADGFLYVSDNGPEQDDRLVKVERGGNAGWPNSLLPGAIKLWNPTVAPTAVAFCDGAGFPQAFQGRLFVALSGPTFLLGPTERGKRIEMFTLGEDGSVTSGETFLNYIGNGRATVVGLAFGPDGLYFTDLYGEDGFDIHLVTHSNVYRVSYQPATEVPNREASAPTRLVLAQNYPNPFNPATSIEFSIPQSGYVTLKVFNILGKEITTLIANRLSAGNHKVVWHANALPSGVYVYQLRLADLVKTKKLVLVR
ncbi:MAG: PQQ-dependent sugar dehydrogenase, partial [bacterium]